MSECCVLLYALLGFNVISLNLQSLIYYLKPFFFLHAFCTVVKVKKIKFLGKFLLLISHEDTRETVENPWLNQNMSIAHCVDIVMLFWASGRITVMVKTRQ